MLKFIVYCIHNYTIHTTLLQITKYVYINAPPVLLHLHSLTAISTDAPDTAFITLCEKKCKIVEPEAL